MEKSKLIKKIRELVQTAHVRDDITMNQSEIAVIMKTFGVSWNEIKQTSDTFSPYYVRKLTENDLRQELESTIEMLKRAREKGLRSEERNITLMLKGFLKGVKFFNHELSDELSIIADTKLVST